MASVSLAPSVRQQFFDANGKPLSGGSVYTYQSGTSTPQATYTDSTGVTQNSNPIVLDSSGACNMWLDISLSYKLVVKDSGGNQIDMKDGVIGLISNNTVSTPAIQAAAVTTAKLANNAVTSAILASDASIDANRAVQTNHIQNAQITRAKLAAGAVANSSIVSKSAAYTVVATTDDTVLADATSAAFNITLPDAASCVGKTVVVKKIDISANAVTVATTSSQTIDLLTTYPLTYQNDFVMVESDGSNWKIVSYKAKQIVVGTPLTASVFTTSTTYGNLSTRLNVTVTAKTSGPYRIHVKFPMYIGADGFTAYAKLIATSGSPTVLENGGVVQLFNGSNFTRDCYAFTLVTLTAGSAYTFDLQWRVTGSTATIDGALYNTEFGNGIAVIAEQIA